MIPAWATLPTGGLFVRQPVPSRAQWFLAGSVLLLVIGLAILYSATATRAYAAEGESFAFLFRQLKGVILGGAALAVAAHLNPRVWLRGALPLLILSAALLALIQIPGVGVERNQATRWISVGLVVFQPSEIAKLAVPLFVAWCAWRFPPSSTSTWSKRTLLRSGQVVTIGSVAALVAAGPDYGTALFILAVGGTLLLISGMSLWTVPAGFILTAPAGYFLYQLRAVELEERFRALVNPESVYQVRRALFGLGSGGTVGKGLGQGIESYYLPEQHSDFIFSIVGEEVGFLGVAVIVILFSLLLQTGWRVVRNCPDRALRIAAFGIVMNIVLQAVINIAVTTASAPTKGISLPFVSYGSTGLTIFLLQVGILIAIARTSGHERSPDAGTP